jgi:hypothetical protein
LSRMTWSIGEHGEGMVEVVVPIVCVRVGVEVGVGGAVQLSRWRFRCVGNEAETSRCSYIRHGVRKFAC